MDIDAFYASVEQKLDPDLRGKPVIVGPDPNKGATRGVVLTASYEARKFGVKSAMPIKKAHQLCPDAVYRFTGFKEYRKESKNVMNALSQFTDELQQVSIDEAYLQFPVNFFSEVKEVLNYCQKIQDMVWEKELISISIGASHTKTIAKIGCGLEKPRGITIIPENKFREILDPLPLKEIPGIGKKTSNMLELNGYKIIGDIAQFTIKTVPDNLKDIWYRVHGYSSKKAPRTRSRSHSREKTFGKDESDHIKLRNVLRKLTDRLLSDLKDKSFRTYSIKVRFSNFKTMTRSKTFYNFISPMEKSTRRICIQTANELFNEFLEIKVNTKVNFRLLGVKASNFSRGIKIQRKLSDWLF